MERTAGNARLDEHLFNSYDSPRPAKPWGMIGGRFVAMDDAPPMQQGGFVAPSIFERGYNAWFGAPGYMIDAPGTDRVIPDHKQPIVNSPNLGVNPWDHIFGTLGSQGVNDGVGVRDWGDQAGVYSNS